MNHFEIECHKDLSKSNNFYFFLLLLVLVNEGESCRVIGFISEGTCNLKRCVDVAKTNRDGTKVCCCTFSPPEECLE